MSQHAKTSPPVPIWRRTPVLVVALVALALVAVPAVPFRAEASGADRIDRENSAGKWNQ
jgi:hypothetical protein